MFKGNNFISFQNQFLLEFPKKSLSKIFSYKYDFQNFSFKFNFKNSI